MFIVSCSISYGVTASQITKDFYSNSLRADSLYKNRNVTISGTITRITSSGGYPLVGLSGSGSSVVACRFPKSLMNTLFKLKSGDKVTITGRCVSGSRSSVVLENCIVGSAPQPQPSSGKRSYTNYGTQYASRAMFSDAEKAKIKQAIVTIEGEDGVGTGFFCKLPNGKTAIITNSHVLWENSDVKYYDARGNEIPTTGLAFAKYRDLAFLYPSDQKQHPCLEIQADCSTMPSGSPVCVFGNSHGEGVTTELYGAITGVGPKKIECSARFIRGNSGSPIVSMKTGKVIGVATYASLREPLEIEGGSNSRFGQVRRFGFRIDNFDMKNLQPFNERTYERDHKMLQKLTTCLYQAKILSIITDPVFSRYLSSRSSSSTRRSYSTRSNYSTRSSFSSRNSSKRGFKEVKKLTSGRLAFLDMELPEDVFEKYDLKEFVTKWNQQYEYNKDKRGNSRDKYMVSYVPYRILLNNQQRKLATYQKYYKRHRYYYTSMKNAAEEFGKEFEEDMKELDKKMKKIKR